MIALLFGFFTFWCTVKENGRKGVEWSVRFVFPDNIFVSCDYDESDEKIFLMNFV